MYNELPNKNTNKLTQTGDHHEARTTTARANPQQTLSTGGLCDGNRTWSNSAQNTTGVHLTRSRWTKRALHVPTTPSQALADAMDLNIHDKVQQGAEQDSTGAALEESLPTRIQALAMQRAFRPGARDRCADALY